MKNSVRSILVLGLAAALVLSFSAISQATYRGFTPIRTQAEIDAGILQGFITFGEAQVEMARNNTPADLQGTAHGGYITTSSKCAVCHSAHRASGVNPDAVEGTAAGSTSGAANLANVRNQYFLTAGSATCEGCHVSTGAQASRLLVEWGTSAGGGPHRAPARGCTMCHNAGIHGLEGSRFNVMNVFMLGNTRNRSVSGADWPVDNAVLERDIETRDEQIAREIMEGRILRGETLDIPVDSSFGRNPVVADPSAGSTWWYNGVRALGPVGGLPTGFAGAPNGNQYAAARSLATAYTCGEIGCHVNTTMFNLNWGMGFERRNQVRDEVTGAGLLQGLTEVTGHILPSVRVQGGANTACGPCHAGNPAGFPTASTRAGERDDSRRAWGCDQCHDMVGVATNSTAWPHGNRDITVYEWAADGTQEENFIPMSFIGGLNLWMYGGNIARADRADVPIGDGTQTGAGITDAGGGATFRGATSENISFADQSWTVLTGVTSGRYGIPGHTGFTDDPQGAFGNPQVLNVPGTGLTDGSCLKCHVAIDDASRDALGTVGADALRHAWNRGGTHSSSNPAWGDAANPSWDGTLPNGSSRLFLYR